MIHSTTDERDRLARHPLLSLVRRAAPDWMALAWLYRKAHGRMPNLVRPSRFTEKVLWRTLFDRRPFLAMISDKACAREYVASAVGEQFLPRLYWSTTQPADVPWDELPQRFVVRPTHGSGWIAVVRDKLRENRDAIVQ